MTKKILHICGLDKFIPSFIGLIRENFPQNKHFFLTKGDIEKYPYTIKNDTKHLNTKQNKFYSLLYSIFYNLKYMYQAEKIILHNLFDQKIVYLLALNPWLLKKCFWVMWGADLYAYEQPRSSMQQKLYEQVRHFVIKRIGYLVTYIEGDAHLAKKWYGAKGQQLECIMYMSNVFNSTVADNKVETTVETIAETTAETIAETVHTTAAGAGNNDLKCKDSANQINILLGNSADPSNNHLDAFQKLTPFINEDIHIYVPLSYGCKQQAEKVIAQGSQLFAEKFIPLTNFMPLNSYHNLLASIDIAIFNHNRQQAMGNIVNLLGLGKTVYMPSNITPWEFLKQKGLKVCDVTNFNMQKITSADAQHNINIITSYFSKENLIKQLDNIFKLKM